MAVRLRLQRIGKLKKPYYRIVAIDQRTKRDGKPLEILGQYDPMLLDNKININVDRLNYWINVGAKTSDTLSALFKKLKLQKNK
ncbi:MAG: 30S ribosomal protein S16 [Endomicrobium sp.]|nr:30S ribosomal protein S16 [Endomicrobium sp.]